MRDYKNLSMFHVTSAEQFRIFVMFLEGMFSFDRGGGGGERYGHVLESLPNGIDRTFSPVELFPWGASNPFL